MIQVSRDHAEDLAKVEQVAVVRQQAVLLDLLVSGHACHGRPR